MLHSAIQGCIHILLSSSDLTSICSEVTKLNICTKALSYLWNLDA